MTQHNLLIGGFLPKQTLGEVVPFPESSYAFQWQSSGAGLRAFLWVRGNNFTRVESGQRLIVGLGHISNNKGEVGETVLREIERNLRHHSRLPINNLEGSFSLVIVDKTKKKITLYRNIVGLPPIYYTRKNHLTLFSDNLAYLVWVASKIIYQKLTINNPQLIYSFLYKRASGTETLFNEIRRIMVGEQICFQLNNFSRLQVQNLSDMKTLHIKDCGEHLELVMKKIIMEYATTYPDIVNIFSGGVDSSYVQAHLSRCYGRAISTFSLDIVHPSPIWQIEREYARSGSEFFQSDHTFVKVTPLEYPKLLMRGISELGLPLPETQFALVPKLCDYVKKTSSVATCGMAADCLFGLELCQDIDIAYMIERAVPFKFFPKILSKISRLLPEKKMREKLTNILDLDLHDCSSPKHPFNISDRARLEAICKLFGHAEVAKAISKRQDLMKQFQVEGSLKECYHSLIILAEGINDAEDFYQLASNVGLNVLFPYLDSRMIKVALSMGDLRFSFGRTKKVLKDSLRKYMPRKLVLRKKSGWGLPIFEWMSPNGVLYPLVKELTNDAFASRKFNIERKPDIFTWVLLNFNIWRKQFQRAGLSRNWF